MKTIGITGNIAAGKSSFCQILSDVGPCLIVDIDKEAHALYKEDPNLLKEITNHFGSELLVQGQLDRKALGKIVFADPSALEKLNQIVHPKLKERITKILDEKRPDVDFLILEGALLFEWGLDELLHYMIFVDAPRETRIKRLIAKGFDLEQATQRVEAQKPTEDKISKSDFVIESVGEMEDLYNEAERIWEILRII